MTITTTRSDLTLDEIAAVLLDPSVAPGDLHRAAGALYEMFRALSPLDERAEDSAHSWGKAIAPRLAAMCIRDAVRTAKFLRGVEQALRERSPAEVVYAGTGPYAPLVIPLMARFPGLRFTLIDVHPSSIDSVALLTGHFGLTNCRLVVADAANYLHPRPIDLLIVETMQSALANEPQVAIVGHLLPQLAPGGVLIPQRITIDAVLVDGGAETLRAMGEPLPAGARIPLGTVVELSRDVARFELSVEVPEHRGHALAYFTRVEVFGDHLLDEYDSAITYPQIQWNVSAQPGEMMRFHYQSGPQPGLRIERQAGAASFLPLSRPVRSGGAIQLDVPWHGTPAIAITAMFDLAELGPDDFLLDLGSGDGRIAIEAARRFGIHAAGIDIDPEQVKKATREAVAAGVADRVSFQVGDLLEADVSDASVVTLFLLPHVNLRLREKLRAQLRPGSRIISRAFDLGDWTAETVLQTALGPIYRWRL